MSREIDERVVQMKFESGQFNRDIQTSIHNLDELKRGLDFKDAVNGFDELDTKAKNTDISALGRAVEEVRMKFSLLDVMAFNVMNRISNMAIETGKRFVSSLTIDQITPGWDKYADKTVAVQTIMAATAKQFSDTGVQMEYVNSQLDKLNWFTDETSYNFVDMVGNIGKFTSNNIKLEDAVTAMQGIANWAAVSGANAASASRAMYNLSQSISSGAMTLMDWMSIENANMATAAFKEMAIESALAAGTLVKSGDKIMTANKKVEVSVETFRGTLSEKWFTSDVIIQTLDRYGAATNKLNEIYEETGLMTSQILTDIDEYATGAKTAAEISEEWGISLEQTQEYLDAFDSDLMKFGVTAFKAAQEAKTFGDAIDSVKDAVSTGWMKSFEIIFGDYMQAKEFWTQIANTLYDVFASSSEARNEMLEEWSENQGREYFIDSIYATLGLIINALTTIKAAWRSVFGTTSGTQLADLTKKLNRFLVSLMNNEKFMVNMTRTFRGFFSILDMIRTTIVKLVEGALSVLNKILGEVNLNIGDFAGTIGDVLFVLSRWYRQTDFIEQAFNALGDAIINVIRFVKQFISSLEDFGPIKSILNKLSSWFGRDMGLIEAILYSAGGAIAWLFGLLGNLRFPSSLDDAKQMLINLGNYIKTTFEAIGFNFANIEKVFTSFRDVTKDTFESTNGILGKTMGLISGFVEFVNALDIDWAGVLLAGYGITALAILWKLTDALKGFATAVTNITQVGKSAKGAMDSISGYFKQLTKNAKSDSMVKTAIALAALAGAMYLFAQLDWGSVIRGGLATVVLVGSVAALSFAMSKLAGENGWGKGLAETLLALSAGVALLAVALKLIPVDKTLQDRVGVVIVTMVALGVLSVVMAKWGGPITASAASMIGIASAIFILIKTMQSIGREDIGSIYAAVPVVRALMIVLARLSSMMTYTKSVTTTIGDYKTVTKNGSGFASVIGLVLGLKLLIMTIKSLSKEDPAEILKGAILMIPVMALLKKLFKASQEAGKEAVSAGKMILFIAASLLIIGPAIRNLASIPIGELVKGGAVIAALSLLIFKPLIKASKDAGQYAGKAGILILAMTGAMAVIQLVIKTLSKMDTVELIKGTASVGLVILAFSEMVKKMQKEGSAATNASDVDVWKKILLVVAAVGAILVALTWLDPTGALIASAGLSAVFLSLGTFFRLANEMQLPSTKQIFAMVGITAALASIIGILGAITDWRGALAVAGGMSMLLLTLASMTQIMKNSATSDTFRKKINSMIPIVVSLGALMAIFATISALASVAGADMTQVLAITTGMSELIISLGLMTKLFGKMSLPSEKKLAEFTKILRTVGITAGVMVGILAVMAAAASAIGWDMSGILLLTTATSELMIAMGATIKLMNGTEMPKTSIESLVSMGVFMAAIGSVLAIIMGLVNEFNADISGIISLSTAIGIVLVSLGSSVALMGKYGSSFQMGIKQAAALGILVGAVGGILGLMSQWTDPVAVLPLAIGCSAVLLAGAQAAILLSKVPPGSLQGGIEGAAIMVTAIAAIGVLMIAMGALAQIPFVKDLLNGGIEMLSAIGRGIGAFVGGIIGGVGEGIMNSFPAMCQALSEGAVALEPFYKALENIPGGAIGLIGTFVGMLVAMTGAQLISGLKLLPGIGPLLVAGSLTLSHDFANFGKALKAFSDSIEGVDVDRVKTAAEAVSLLGGMESSLNSIFTIVGKIFGGDDLGAFSERLSALGDGIAAFAEKTKDITPDSVSAAVSAAQMLMGLEENLPKSGGLVGMIFGEQDLSKFGERLATFGSAISTFSWIVQDVSVENVENAKNAGDLLAKLEKSLEPAGGVIQDWFFGNKDLAGFGERLKTFGEAMVDFNSEVSGNLDPDAFDTAVTCASALSELEKNLDTTGGVGAFWSGDSSLESFGSNIKSFGASLFAFSNQLKATDLGKIEDAISYIERLIALQDIDTASSEALAAAKTLIKDVTDVITEHEKDFKEDGKTLMKYLAEGFQEGTQAYKYIAVSASRALANTIVNTFKRQLGIHSPSVVMKEQGYYIIEGVAEGIDSNTSAEEAIKKKADNIVSAFNTEISRLNSINTTGDLEFSLWQMTDGKNASDVEIAQKQLEIEKQKLATLAKTVGAKQAAMELIAEVAGKDSDEYRSAYQEYLQAQIDMLTKQQDIDAVLQNGITDPRDQMNAFAAFMKENQQVYEMLGKSQEELEAAAYKAAYGLDEEAVARKKAYEGYLAEYAESFEMLGKTREELDAFAKEKSGWEGIAANANQTMSDTSQIIADNIDAYQVNIQETIETATAEAIRNSTKSGSGSAAAAAEAGIELGEVFGENAEPSFVENIQSAVKEAMEGENGLVKSLEGYSDIDGTLAQVSKYVGNVLGIEIPVGAIEELAGHSDDIQTQIQNIMSATPETIERVSASAKTLGNSFTIGYKNGLMNTKAISGLMSAAKTMTNMVAQKVAETQDSASPSKVAIGLGEDFTDGYAIGISETNEVEDAAEFLGSTTADTVESKAGYNAGQSIGSEFGQGVVNGIESKVASAKAAASKLSTAANQLTTTSWTSSGGGGGGGGYTRVDYDKIYGMLGMPTSKDADKAISQLGKNVSSGLAKGISSGTSEIKSASKAAASTVTSTMAATLQVHSPSRLTQAIGNYVSIGLGNGIIEKANYITDASDYVSNELVSSISYAAQAVNDIVNNDEDFSPVITPVLDMDELKREASGIPGLLNSDRSISLTSAKLRVSQLNAEKTSTLGQNGSQDASAPSYNFVQNNYSPKALNRSEIYRQTNNQFSRIKEATKR